MNYCYVPQQEYGAAANTKPGMKKKAPARRIPMSKARASTQETMEFTLEPKEVGEGKKRKERVKKRPWPELLADLL